MKNIQPYQNRTLWLWIPTLYFAQGIPYFLVNNISVMMLTKMGVSNGEMALFTSLLYLPWTIKPFWSPLIDMVKTKRWWILSMQLLMAAAFILLTLTLPHPSTDSIAAVNTPISLFSFTLFLFIVTAFASATHDIAADGFYMLALQQQEQAAFVGIRSTFYRLASAFGQGVLISIAGVIELKYHHIPLSWTVTLGITALLFSLLSLYHLFAIPKPANDHAVLTPRAGDTANLCKEFIHTFATYFQKPGVLLAITFMLLYRLPEAFLLKLCMPFLSAPKTAGGLQLPTTDVGWVYGIMGTVALTVGGILGGWFIAQKGLKQSLWLMAFSITLPCLAFVFLSVFQPSSLWIIAPAIAIDQFGYGFGFTAYLLYLMYFSEGECKTSHYAICTAFMALSMMVPGMFAGYLQEFLGYTGFFWMIMGCCLVTLTVTWLVSRKLNTDYGKESL